MGTAERKERERNRRQNDILDAAEEVFFTKGFNEATMADVAEKAELSKGTLYLYFKNKEALYLGINLRAMEALKRKFEETLREHDKASSKVLALGLAYIDYAIEYPYYFKTMSFVEALQLESYERINEDTLMQKCHIAGSGILQLLADTVKLGQEAGYLRPELNPMKTAILLWASSNGVILMNQNKGGHFYEAHGFDKDFLLDEYMRFCTLAMYKIPPELPIE